MKNLHIIRPVQTAKLLGVSVPTLYRLMKQPDFPSRIQLSKQCVGFRESEIEEWIESRKEKNI